MVNWSGRTSAYPHKHGDWQNADLSGTPEAFQTQKILYAQWTKCPIEVENEVKKLWRMNEFGNDNYYYKTTLNEILELSDGEETFENLIYFARLNGLKDDEEFLIHWWW